MYPLLAAAAAAPAAALHVLLLLLHCCCGCCGGGGSARRCREAGANLSQLRDAAVWMQDCVIQLIHLLHRVEQLACTAAPTPQPACFMQVLRATDWVVNH
jgi:hypothetical protein